MQWSYFYTLDAQGRLSLPWEALSSRSGPFLTPQGIYRVRLCLAETAFGLQKPCIFILSQDGPSEDDFSLPDGFAEVAMAGYSPNRGNAIYDDGRIRLTKHQRLHLCGRSQIGGMSKQDRMMMVTWLHGYLVVTNATLWR